jgi:hypothetical protein
MSNSWIERIASDSQEGKVVAAVGDASDAGAISTELFAVIYTVVDTSLARRHTIVRRRVSFTYGL